MFSSGLMRPPWAGTAGIYRPRRIERPSDAIMAHLKRALRSLSGNSAFLKRAAIGWEQVNDGPPPPAALGAAADMLNGRAVDLNDPVDRRIALSLSAAATGLARGRVHVVCYTDGMAEAAHAKATALLAHLGISHALIGRRDDLAARRAAYSAAVVYVPARRVAQDALLDAETLKGSATSDRARVRRLAAANGEDAPVLGRGAAAAFIDDADLILLGASAPASLGGDAGEMEGRRLANEAFAIVSALTQPTHYEIDPITRRIRLTSAGEERSASFAVAFGQPWTAQSWRTETVLAALAIRDLYEFGRNYSLEDGRVVLVGGGATAAATPSIPDLIAAKEGFDVMSSGARQISLPKFLGRYPHLGAVGVDMWSARREMKQSSGLAVRRRGPAAPVLRAETFADFAGKMARLKHLADEGWTLWAPTEADATPLKELGTEIIVGAVLIENHVDRGRCLQAAATAPQVEIRFASVHPNGGAVISAEDKYFEPVEAPLLAKIREGEIAMTEETYRQLQSLREDIAADLRAKQARADAYFDAVMAFAGDDV